MWPEKVSRPTFLAAPPCPPQLPASLPNSHISYVWYTYVIIHVKLVCTILVCTLPCLCNSCPHCASSLSLSALLFRQAAPPLAPAPFLILPSTSTNGSFALQCFCISPLWFILLQYVHHPVLGALEGQKLDFSTITGVYHMFANSCPVLTSKVNQDKLQTSFLLLIRWNQNPSLKILSFSWSPFF